MELSNLISNSALAFRGYDVKNLGRTNELLSIPAYREHLVHHLEIASEECSNTLGRDVDLVKHIESEEEFTLDQYGEAISMIVAVEQGQLQILQDCFELDYREAMFSFGFSLGEISALVAGGTFALDDALRVPLMLSPDGIELAHDVTLGIVFSRKEELSVEDIERTLLELNTKGDGVIGISTHLSPNSVLVMGTGSTIDRLKNRLKEEFPKGTNLRCNDSKWPPIHTPIILEKDFTARVGRYLHTNPTGFGKPKPDILSLVTADFTYNDYNARDHMIRWTGQKQLMWEAVEAVLHSDVQTLIHVGPDPNIIPSTFDRLSKNVIAQTEASKGIQALARAVDRPWLRKLMPHRADLLRAPSLKHVILEDWLIDNVPN